MRLLFFLLSTCCCLLVVITAEEDLYKILGVSRTASTKEIKQAYRRKARDTHPDKAPKDLPKEEAAERFRQVVHAFEILSDKTSRRRYDQTGSASSSSQQQQDYGYSFFHWTFRRRPIRLKDRFEVQEAQSRVIHVVSLEQLETVMLDDSDRLERNLLICFVVPGQVETRADDEMVFPYPFAAMSSQGIWWEDLLQTVKVRFHKSNELSKFFEIPAGDELRASGQPVFVFGKRGQRLQDFTKLQTSSRKEFERWVWKQMEVSVEFVNRHDFPVEIYWIHGNRAQLQLTLPPNEMANHVTMLSHEWFVRDARVDTFKGTPGRYKLTTDSSLASLKILNDTSPQTIVIAAQTCFDLSGHCGFWKHQGECRKNPRFMQEQCTKTCKLCQADTRDEL